MYKYHKVQSRRFQIIVPAFNEEASIEYVLNHAKNHGYLGDMVVVDDASKDRTPEVLREWVEEYGLNAILLNENCKKEGAIRVALNLLGERGVLKPFTILLDADSMLVGNSSGVSIIEQIESCIDRMEDENFDALALRIDAALKGRPKFFEMCAYADYTAMQVDQTIVGLQRQVWVINGPGGIFNSNQLLQVLKTIEPDFETGDLLITVKLMLKKRSVGFCKEFGVDTFVPTDVKAYFNQRRRWERGTTKVLWNERRFYFGLFKRPTLLGILTLVHLSLYFCLCVTLVLVGITDSEIGDLPMILGWSGFVWFLIGVVKGIAIKFMRPDFKFWRYSYYSFMNSMLWVVVTTPARLTGFIEGVKYLVMNKKRSTTLGLNPVGYVWLVSSSDLA